MTKHDKTNITLLDRTFENMIKVAPNDEIIAIINLANTGMNPTFISAATANSVSVFAR